MLRNNPFRKIYDDNIYKGLVAKKFPEIVDIELTNHCNLKCKMCARQNMTRLKGFMAENTFKNVVLECLEHNTPIRLIGWGEPFLHPKIIDFVSYAKSLYSIDKTTLKTEPLYIHITNNGQIVSEKQLKELVDLKLNSIIFSFQGANKQSYESMRIGASYDKIKDNILKLVELRGEKEQPFIHISSTMTNESKEEIEKFVDYWQKIVDSVDIGKTKPIEAEKGYKYYKPCTEVLHKLTVKWDGQVSACCGDYDNYLIVGGLGKEKLYDIYNGSVLNSIRNLLINNKFRSLTLCKNCSHTYENF